MARFASGTLVAVRPFVHRPDGEATIIGDVDRNVYLSIPTQALDILQSLTDGKTVGEAASRYQEKYADTPDIEDFLNVLAAEGFVSSTGDQITERPAGPSDHQHRQIKRWSFDWISPALARRLTSPLVLIVGTAIIAFGITLVVLDPALVPGPRVLLFEQGNFAALTWATFFIGMLGVSIHEVAHAVAARSVGVTASLGISNLMYVLVAQTDISGIWMVPRRQRYKAFLAGFFVDLVIGSLLVSFLYATRHGVISAPKSAQLLVSAALLTFMIRVLFQFFFYLRTDIYYVIATALNCKNLMADTERLLANLVKRLTFQRGKVIAQPGIPRAERRAVRVYSAFYLFGRIFALAALAFTILPVLWGYVEQFVLLLTGRPTRFESIDFVTLAILAAMINGGGLFLWGRSLLRGYLRRRQARLATMATGS